VAALCKNHNYVTFVALIRAMSILRFEASALGAGGVQTVYFCRLKPCKEIHEDYHFRGGCSVASIFKVEVKMEASFSKTLSSQTT
jgi:hypothetical protein